ncbi:MAG TPA: hypothetical protein VIF62_28290 [Labilithrix sp.]
MSMKRTKQRGAGGGRDKELDSNFWGKPTEPEKTWDEQVDGKPDEEFTPYSMTQRFTKGQLVLHTKFGKGVVTDVETGRIEILFQEGKKKLGHGAAG